MDLCTGARHGAAGRVVHLGAFAPHHHPVAVVEIADRVRERRERDRVRAEIHLAVAIADRERRAAPRADQQVLLALEQEGEREGAREPRQRGRDRRDRREAFLQLARHQMSDHLGVGLGREPRAAGRELVRAAR